VDFVEKIGAEPSDLMAAGTHWFYFPLLCTQMFFDLAGWSFHSIYAFVAI